MLKFNPKSAAQADNINSQITDSGKYVGTITRAEKLLSSKGTHGLGLSFKSDAGETADYLDLYTVNAAGEELPSMRVVNAIMGCLGLREAHEGKITVSKYSKEAGQKEMVTIDGYPSLMGKSIGLLLQKEISTHQTTGKDVERMIVFGVFQPETELTVSEILDRKTVPERLAKHVAALAAKPVRDSRAKATSATPKPAGLAPSAFADMIDEIPF